ASSVRATNGSSRQSRRGRRRAGRSDMGVMMAEASRRTAGWRSVDGTAEGDPSMTTYPRDEVEAAFRHYWEVGAVGEDWDAWVDECFTDDVTYIEHVLGNMSGREEVRDWIKPIMDAYAELYTAYEWH